MIITDLFRRVFIFFFKPNSFEKEALNRAVPDIVTKPELLEQSIEKCQKLRAHVIRAFWFVLITGIISTAFSLALRFAFHLHIPHIFLTMLKITAYLLILWGVYSEVGHPLRTWGGESLPEIFDKEWHKLAYGTGIFFLIVSYVMEL